MYLSTPKIRSQQRESRHIKGAPVSWTVSSPIKIFSRVFSSSLKSSIQRELPFFPVKLLSFNAANSRPCFPNNPNLLLLRAQSSKLRYVPLNFVTSKYIKRNEFSLDVRQK